MASTSRYERPAQADGGYGEGRSDRAEHTGIGELIEDMLGLYRMTPIDPRPAPDTRVELDQVTLYAIAFSFLIGLPLVFVLTGVFIWWRRRKAA